MIRLQKIIAQAGIASRRKAEEFILAKKVKVNGKISILGDKATLKDEIIVNGVLVTKKENKVYFVLNKPEKFITSLKDPQGRAIVTDLFDVPERIFPVGRLDYYTTGVLIMTNDGELSHKLTHPSYEILRVYRARITKVLTSDELKFLNSNAVYIKDKISKQKVDKVDTKSYVVTLHQGTYHHVKELFELVGAQVLKLTRIEYAGINVLDMKSGSYRKLQTKEIKWLKQLVIK